MLKAAGVEEALTGWRGTQYMVQFSLQNTQDPK